MRHADHDLLHPRGARALDQFVDRRNQALAALEREALLPDVARMQISLELLGLGQLLQQALLHLRRVLGRRPDRLDALLDPVPLRAVADEHVLEADVAAVRVAQRVDQVPERGAVQPDERADADFAVQVRLGEVVVGRLELRHRRARHALERVERRPARAGDAVRGHQQQGRDLQPLVRHVNLRRRASRQFSRLAALHEGLDHGRVRHVLARAARRVRHQLHLIEVLAPFVWHGAGVGQILLVQLLDERRVAAEQVGTREQLLHHGVHLLSMGRTSRRVAPL